MNRRTAKPGADRARELAALTGNKFTVTFEPGAYLDDEERCDPQPSLGHLFRVKFRERHLPDNTWNKVSFWLDDREGPLEEQMTKELFRIGEVYVKLWDEFVSASGRDRPRRGRRSRASA